MRLFELFDKPVSIWSWNDHGGGYYVAEFVVGGKIYSVDFHRTTIQDQFLDQFYNAGIEPPADLQELGEEDAVVYELEFLLLTGGRYLQKITGTGDAYKVFSTVIAIAKEFVNEHDVDYLIFSAKERSRRSLYDKIIKALRKPVSAFQLPGDRYIDYVVEV